MRLARLLLTILIGGLAFAGAAQSPKPSLPALVPTAHPPVPRSLEDLWLAPTEVASARESSAPLSVLQDAVRLHVEGDHERALEILTDPSWKVTTLGNYAAYYAGLAQLRLRRFAEALRTLTALLDTKPMGHLSEAAALAAAEAADELDQEDVALRICEDLSARRTVATETILYRLAQTALATGDRRKAAETLLRLYYEFPLSDQALLAAVDLKSLRADAGGPGTLLTFSKDLERARRLADAGRHEEARAGLVDLRALATGNVQAAVDLELAASEYHLRRYRAARDRLRPYLDRESPDQAKVLFYYMSTLRGLGRDQDFVTRARDLVTRFPDSPWAEAALDALGTHYLVDNQDDAAIEAFRELYARFPSGRRAERAAWKAGWWAYRHGDLVEAVRLFDTAAATFRRSDYRPSYLYWSGRAWAAMGDRTVAGDRLALVVTDYGSSYYGRLAARDLPRVPAAPRATQVSGTTRTPRAPTAAEPPTASLIRSLLATELYDAALDELEYARRVWGPTPAIDATIALVLHRQGEFGRASVAIRRAYPQYLTKDAGGLPAEVLRVVFPLDYWALIRKHASAVGLDPHLVAALIAQESMFDASARSSANAYGLMQLVPATGRRVGRTLGIRRVTVRSLVDPETNIRLGTRHFADLLKQFGEPHLALAAYNAGEHRVAVWRTERQGLSQDEFVDDIPFPETQVYVRRILGTTEDYRQLYPLGRDVGSK